MILSPRATSPQVFRAFSAGFPASYTPFAWPLSLPFHAPAAALSGASSYRCPPQCPPRSPSPPHPPHHLFVLHRCTHPPATRNDQYIQCGMILDRVVRLYQEIAQRLHRPLALCDMVDVDSCVGSPLILPRRLQPPGDRKDFKWSTKVEDFRILKKEYPNGKFSILCWHDRIPFLILCEMVSRDNLAS